MKKKNFCWLFLLCALLLLSMPSAKATIIYPKDTTLRSVNFYSNFTLDSPTGTVQITPLVLVNGVTYSLANLQLINPTMGYQTEISTTAQKIKWAMNFTKIPVLTASRFQAMYWDFDFGRAIPTIINGSIEKMLVFPDGMILSFRDLKKSGYSVYWVNKTRLFIGNITPNLKANSLLFDPTIYFVCGGSILSSGYYEMNQSLECSTDGVLILSNDVDFNCKNFFIQWGTGYGIYVNPGTNLTVRNCFLNHSTLDSDNYGIAIDTFVGDNITILNSQVKTNSDYSYALYSVSYGGNITAKNTMFESNGGYSTNAIDIADGSGNYFLFDNITARVLGGGYALIDDVTGNIHIFNSTIYTEGASNALGVYLYYNGEITNSDLLTAAETNNLLTIDDRGSGRHLFKNNKFRTTSANAGISQCIKIAGGSINSLFENNTIESGCLIELENNENGCSNTTFLNSSFNRGSFILNQSCNATVKVGWFGRVNVTNSTGKPLVSTVNMTTVYGGLENLTATDSNGLTGYLTAWQMLLNSSNIIFNYGNHTIVANASGYVNNQTVRNITAPFFFSLVLFPAGGNAPPQYSFVNATPNSTVRGGAVLLSSFWTDDLNMSGVILEYNGANTSFVVINNNSNASWLVYAPFYFGDYFYRFYGNDSNNAWNATPIHSFQVSEPIPAGGGGFYGAGLPNLSYSPTNFTFRYLIPNQTVRKILTVKNNDAGLHNVSFGGIPAYLKIEPSWVVVSPNGTEAFTVDFTPTQGGLVYDGFFNIHVENSYYAKVPIHAVFGEPTWLSWFFSPEDELRIIDAWNWSVEHWYYPLFLLIALVLAYEINKEEKWI